MAKRVPLLAGNWKMHGTPSEAVELATALRQKVEGVADRDVLVAPAFPALSAVAACLRGSRILLSGQNLHWEEKGAFTGEVSGAMLAGAGCTHVIVGHSIPALDGGVVGPGAPASSPARLRNCRLVTIFVAKSAMDAPLPAPVIDAISGRSDASTVRPSA